jgi:ABC-2 type transport system ATP-binding protein
VLTPEAGGVNVPLADADRAADVLIGLRHAGISITTANVQQPTLDEVFLALTGHGTDSPQDRAQIDNHSDIHTEEVA